MIWIFGLAAAFAFISYRLGVVSVWASVLTTGIGFMSLIVVVLAVALVRTKARKRREAPNTGKNMS